MTDLAWMKTYIGTETSLTGHLTAEEFGCYERLRRHYWQHGALPDDATRLARITGIEPERWPQIASAIRLLMADMMAKLEQERIVATDKREKKIAAGRKGAVAKWSKAAENGNTNAFANGKTMAEPMRLPSVCQWPLASASDEERYEEEVAPTHTPAREKETLPSFSSMREFREWLSTHVFPGNENFEPLVRKWMDGALTMDDVRGAAA